MGAGSCTLESEFDGELLFFTDRAGLIGSRFRFAHRSMPMVTTETECSGSVIAKVGPPAIAVEVTRTESG
jgi:hypothetical protein